MNYLQPYNGHSNMPSMDISQVPETAPAGSTSTAFSNLRHTVDTHKSMNFTKQAALRSSKVQRGDAATESTKTFTHLMKS